MYASYFECAFTFVFVLGGEEGGGEMHQPGSPYTALYLLSCVGVKGDLVVAGDDELTTQASTRREGHVCIHKREGKEGEEWRATLLLRGKKSVHLAK